MKENNKVVIIIVAVACLISSIVFWLFWSFGDGPFFTNLEDLYSNEPRQTGKINSYRYSNFMSSNTNNESANASFTSFIGLDTLWDLNATEDGQLIVHYDVESSEGSYKMVLVNYKDKTVTTIVESQGKDQKTYDLKKGKYAIKHVGLKANGEFSLKLQASANIEIRYSQN